jgi:predicted MFS family arabinose efflux permease
VLIVLYATSLHAGAIHIGMLAAAFGLCPMFLSWIVGRWSDRFGSRWFLTFGAMAASAGMLLPYFFAGLPTLYAAALLSGLSNAFYNVSLQNAVGLLSDAHNRTQNFSNYSLTQSFTNFLGPLVAGVSIDALGYNHACVVLVVLSAIPALMLVLWGAALPAGTRREEQHGSIVATLFSAELWPIMALSAVAQTGNDLFQFYLPVYATRAGLSASTVGAVLSTFAVAAFIVRLFISKILRRWSEEQLLAMAFGLGGVAIALVPFVHSAPLIGTLAFFFGLSMGCCGPITMMLAYSRSEEGRSGEALGLRQTVDNFTRFIAPAMFGAIATGIGLAAIFWINALMLGSGVGFARARHSKRRDE